jgi:WD40 repeat protein
MSDVFVSYSRRDQEFVRRLHAALSQHGKDVWVDWEDIAPTAKWQEELNDGIVAADSFLFVLTPSSLTSEYCAAELEEAIKANKKIVPVLRHDANGTPIPDALAAHQWISFRHDDEFSGSVEQLVKALDTDIDWVRAHTRLLLRTNDWEQHERDTSYLLSGSDLRDAEGWLIRAAGKKPEPTELMRAYVAAGRRAAARRQQRLLGGVSIALLVAIVLAIVAAFQWRNAVDQQHQSQSRELAQAAVSNLNNDPELSALLATRAVNLSDTPEADLALRQAVARIQTLHVLKAPAQGAVNDVAYSPGTASYVATAGHDGTARVWNAGSGRIYATLKGPRQALTNIDFSGDGQEVVAASLDNTAEVWPLQHGTQQTGAILDAHPNLSSASSSYVVNKAIFDPKDANVVATASEDGLRLWHADGDGNFTPSALSGGHAKDVAFSRDGRLVAAAYGDGSARVWRVGSASATVLPGAHQTLQAIAFSPDGSLVAAGGDDGVARIWSSDGHPLRQLRGHTQSIQTLAFSPDGRTLATGSLDDTVRVWHVSDGTLADIFRGHADTVNDVRFSSDGHYLVSASRDGTARVWSLDTGDQVSELGGHQQGINAVTINAAGTQIATASDDGTARLWNPLPGALIGTLHEPGIRVARFTPDGRRVMTGGSGNDTLPGSARFWDAGTAKLIAGPFTPLSPDPQVGPIDDFAFSHDGRWVAFAGGLPGSATAYGVCVASTANPKSCKVMGRSASEWHVNSINMVSFSPDARFVVTAGSDGTARVWERTTDRPVGQPMHSGGAVNEARFSPDGRTVVTASEDGTARVWDPRTGRQLGAAMCPDAPHAKACPDPAGAGSPVATASFSPDGRYIVTGSRQLNVAQLWDARTHRAVGPQLVHQDSVLDAEFSHDSRSLVTSSADDTAAIWAVPSGQKTATLRGHTYVVNDAVFSSDDRYVVTASQDHTARVWDARSGQQLALLAGATSNVLSAFFDSAGRRIVAASADGTARIYRCDVCGDIHKDVIPTAGRLDAGRQLTPAERAQYLKGS